ncbi:flagellar biosynthesis protein FlhB [Algicola sagamiensis]|uniref:flagellar biosynthesis protein FlhB n=1 Tax=Algicola sagamiensis TaxID=163869 RepID=UPI0003771E6C|nr:flagellar biosynthesis protein FlhB [Algicola sagamiensis]
MAESSDQERTEEPTAKRLEDARQKGQVARSREMGTAAVLITSAVGFLIVGDELAIGLMQVMHSLFSLNRDQAFDTTKMTEAWAIAFEPIVWPLSILFILVLIASFIGNILLGGFNFSMQAAQPKWSKMSPLAGFKRMFGLNGLVELIKSILKVLVVSLSTYFLLDAFFIDIIRLSIERTPLNMIDAAEIFIWLSLIIVSSLMVIVVVDAPYQKWNHMKQLRMTKQEIKDEHKNTEGSPEVKGRIRRLQMEMSQRRMMQQIPEADVVVTNPTHFSVALKYDGGDGAAPIVVAKGADEVARQIRKIANAHEVPLVEAPMLARAIYYTTELDDPIPEQLFVAVAQVLAYVYQLKKFKAGKGKRPNKLASNLPIPPNFRY